jgi:hypothetical protein
MRVTGYSPIISSRTRYQLAYCGLFAWVYSHIILVRPPTEIHSRTRPRPRSGGLCDRCPSLESITISFDRLFLASSLRHYLM